MEKLGGEKSSTKSMGQHTPTGSSKKSSDSTDDNAGSDSESEKKVDLIADSARENGGLKKFVTR